MENKETPADWFANRPYKPLIGPFELNSEGGGKALVLRYSGCNLRCPLCYAWKNAWLKPDAGIIYTLKAIKNSLQRLRDELKNDKISWIRIQGGEPCISYGRIQNTITLVEQALAQIHHQGLNLKPNTRSVVQTNGLIFSKLTDFQIEEIREDLSRVLKQLQKGKIVFEVSFKSASAGEDLTSQIVGFNNLLEKIVIPIWREGLTNVSVYPVAGLGPCFHNPWILPIDPAFLPDEKVMFERSTWAPRFQELLSHFIKDVVPKHDAYEDFRKNSVTSSGGKIPMEELEPTQFQSSWISGYAGKYGSISVPPIERILRRLDSNINKQWYALFKRQKTWLEVLEKIPISANPTGLLSAVKDMQQIFYPADPSNHYAFL